MKRTKPSKRRAKPSDSALIARVYRRQNAIHAQLAELLRFNGLIRERWLAVSNGLDECIQRLNRIEGKIDGLPEHAKFLAMLTERLNELVPLQSKWSVMEATTKRLLDIAQRVLRQNDTLRLQVAELQAQPPILVDEVPLQPWEPPTAPIDTSDLALANAYMNRPKRQAE